MEKRFSDVLIFNEFGQLLLLHRAEQGGKLAAGSWCLPGGHAEEGELAETTAYRETLEETGLTCPELLHLCDLNNPDGSISSYFLATNLCTLEKQKTSLVLDPFEHHGWAFMDLEDIAEVDCLFDLKDRLLGPELSPAFLIIRLLNSGQILSSYTKLTPEEEVVAKH